MSIINNDAYRFYNELIKGYKQGDMNKGFDSDVNNSFVHAAIHLAAAKAANPFNEDAEASLHYFTMLKNYKKWRSPAIDRRVSRRRFLEAAAKLAALEKENPFMYEIEPVIEPEKDVISLEALAEAEYKKAEAEDIATETYVPVVEKLRMFGVVEEDD